MNNKRLQMKAGITPQPLAILGAITICVIFLAGCDLFTYKRPFDDAYYNNNFIAAIGFDQFVGSSTTVPAVPAADPVTGIVPFWAVTGQWDFAYRYENWNAFGFMTFTDTGSTADSIDTIPSGLSGTAPVYRLKVVNLLTGGDFEAGTGGTWTPSLTASATQSTASPLYGAADMQLTASSGEQITFSPDGEAGAFNASYNYRVFFRYFSNDPFKVEIDGAELQPATDAQFTATAFQGTGSPPVIKFLPPAINTFFTNLKIDNIQATISGKMSLRLLLAPTTTSPTLVAGVYSFSVWVHTDFSAFTDRSPYQLDSLVVTMRPVTPSSLSAASDQYIAAEGWQKLTATLAPAALQFAAGSLDPVFELVLDFNNSRPGQILLSQPELRFNPDGV